MSERIELTGLVGYNVTEDNKLAGKVIATISIPIAEVIEVLMNETILEWKRKLPKPPSQSKPEVPPEYPENLCIASETMPGLSVVSVMRRQNELIRCVKWLIDKS